LSAPPGGGANLASVGLVQPSSQSVRGGVKSGPSVVQPAKASVTEQSNGRRLILRLPLGPRAASKERRKGWRGGAIVNVQ